MLCHFGRTCNGYVATRFIPFSSTAESSASSGYVVFQEHSGKFADFPLNVDKIDKNIAVRVTNTTKSPYVIKKHTHIAEFSVVTPEQSKHIKPVEMAILSKIPQGDPDLTAYLNELLRTNKPEQQNNTFCFPTPGRPEDHTPIQTRILKELIELEDTEKLNPQDNTESRIKILERFDWTDTFLTETQKQAIEDILVDYHDIFTRHRMDIGMNTEFKVKLTPKTMKLSIANSYQCRSIWKKT